MHYLADYGFEDKFCKQVLYPATINKTKYIAHILHVLDFRWTTTNEVLLLPEVPHQEKYRKNGKFGEEIIAGPAFSYTTGVGKLFAKIFSKLWILYYLLRYVKKGEVLISYHTVGLTPIVSLAKTLKKFKLVIEVEEIYSAVNQGISAFKESIELRSVQAADGYIFANPKLFAYIKDQNKPYCVIEGNCLPEPWIAERFRDGKIHLVYAGILNPQKGAGIAVELAKFLPENYKIHIIGYGTKEDISALCDAIKIQQSQGGATVQFDGMKQGEDYIKYIQQCDIGLCPQISDKGYNDASFPSKISSYLANGLRVVATDTAAIHESRFSNMIIVSSNAPQTMAKKIIEMDINEEYDSRKFMQKMVDKHCTELDRLIRSL